MIQMIGIDYTTAPVDVRAVFAFRKSEMPELMQKIREKLNINGLVLLSTCNRIELWISGKKRVEDFLGAVCEVCGLNAEEYRRYFVEREEDEAKKHLFLLTSGLKSAIVAEDQILTQVKEAATFARHCKTIDSKLEVLFRCAITAAKRIKTEVVFHRGNSTAIEGAIRLIEEKYFKLAGKKVMVIGNGEYGRLAAQHLISAGADVTVTIRQYHSGEVRIPDGASAILYGDKYTLFPECDVVVSATASPNYTLFYDKVSALPANGQKILIDFAVPRDIDPEIKNLPGYIIYDIDDFQSKLGDENAQAVIESEKIIDESLEEYRVWSSFRDVIPMIEAVRESAAKDISSKLEKPIQRLGISDADAKALEKSIEHVSGNVISNIFYYLRDNLDEEVFRQCIRAAKSRITEAGDREDG